VPDGERTRNAPHPEALPPRAFCQSPMVYCDDVPENEDANSANTPKPVRPTQTRARAGRGFDYEAAAGPYHLTLLLLGYPTAGNEANGPLRSVAFQVADAALDDIFLTSSGGTREESSVRSAANPTAGNAEYRETASRLHKQSDPLGLDSWRVPNGQQCH
jgi:hypothetical protein